MVSFSAYALARFCPKMCLAAHKSSNRRSKHSGANAAVTFGFKDETAERIGTYLQRVTEAFVLKPTAGDR